MELMSIRLKVALPYVLLTVVVSLIGVFVVTRLVTSTLAERLTNQLLEAGRVVSDSFVRQEVQHTTEARRIAFTEGLGEALRNEDRGAVLQIVEPVFASGPVENVILISPRGNEILHLVKNEAGEIERVGRETGAAGSPVAAPFFLSKNPDEEPRRSLGWNGVNNETYYYTALPVNPRNEFDGVILVGTSIRTLLPRFKTIALADILIYGDDGQIVASTLMSADQETLDMLSLSPVQYLVIINSDDQVRGNAFDMAGRNYTLARAPLQVGNNKIAVYAVILPSDFVVQFAADNRTTYVILFTVVTLVVIGIGYSVSRKIIVPLMTLVRTSRAIAEGDLERRTNIRTNDEIGTLADTFDVMTARLQERTLELETAHEHLKKIDKIKTDFIQISAHELRTPLTLIMGYSQMLEQDTQGNPELSSLVQGILEGSERMSSVVDNMLDISRIDSNALVPRRKDIQVGPIIAKVHKEFEQAFKERNIGFESAGLSELPSISADAELLYKVFHHLVMNAIKYTPDGGGVKVIGSHLNGNDPPQVEIAVCDTGIGVDPSMTELVFEKLHQGGEVLLHSSGRTKFKGGGPGLGLAIARGIVQAHGGRIWVESPGYSEETFPGSKFIVLLPVQAGKTEKP
jgi:signal transduction histidine kinase